MQYMKKPDIVEAYIFGVDDEAMPYVKEGDKDYFHVKNLTGALVKVIKGDYIIPQTHNSLQDPRALAFNPKVFDQYYREVTSVDKAIIDRWEKVT